MKNQQDGEDNSRFNIQVFSVTIAGLIASAINGIIAYIAVYFFKPLWEKFVAWINKHQ